MKKLLFVYNPHSGKCQILTHLAEIIDIFTKGGYEVTAHPTQARDDAMETVRRRAADFDLIVSSGGDGTTNETIKGIMESGCNIPVGIIPAGTMNDFASSIGIPKYMPDAARVIAVGIEYVEKNIMKKKSLPKNYLLLDFFFNKKQKEILKRSYRKKKEDTISKLLVNR